MATAKFYLNHPYEKQTADERKSKAPKVLRKDERPIDLMFSINRDLRFPVTTGERIHPRHWDFKEKRAKKTYSGSIELNLSLDKIKNAILELWRSDKDRPLHELKPLITEIARGKSFVNEKKKIFEALDKFIENYKVEKTSSTLESYTSLRNRLIEFNAIYPIDFDNMDFNFFDAFKSFLYSRPNQNYIGKSLHLSPDKDHYVIQDNEDGLPVGLFDTAVFKYFKSIKAFLVWSDKRGYKINNSHKKWEILKHKHTPIYLTLAELEKLETAKMPNKFVDIARDYLVLECRIGQRISDLKRFNIKDLIGKEWTHTPKKGNRLGGKSITVMFEGYCSNAYVILEKYNFNLPYMRELTLNKNIKKACEAAGITTEMHIDRWSGGKKIRISGKKSQFLSTHTGRKTFITLALQSGMPVEYVMELTGISEYQTLSHYKGKFEKASIKDWLKKMNENNISIMKKAL